MKRSFILSMGILLTLGAGVAGTALAQSDEAVSDYRLGGNAYAGKDYDRAITYYGRAVQQDPGFWQAYQGLGNCYYAKGDRSTALTDYQKSLDLHPDNAQLTPVVRSLRQEVEVLPPLPASNPAAPGAPSSASAPGHFTCGIGLAGAIPTLGGSDENIGFGINGDLGYAFDANLAVLLEIDGLIFSTSIPGASSSEWDLFPAVQYIIPSPGSVVHPFLLGGFGFNDNIAKYSHGGFNVESSDTELMLAVGGGLAFTLGGGLDLDLRAKLIQVLVKDTAFSFLPISAGVQFN